MLTNFNTVRKSVKKDAEHREKCLPTEAQKSLTKRTLDPLSRDKEKWKSVGGIAQLGRLPAALFIVDIGHEHIALAEAKRLGITTFGMVDTNCDPNKVDYSIPANDDANKINRNYYQLYHAAIAEGLAERQAAREEDRRSRQRAEKKAARLLAEAEAEGGRGGRVVVVVTA